MPSPPPTASQDRVPLAALAPFLLITFGLTWGILGLFAFLPGAMTGLFGPLTGQHPLFFLAIYAPAIAALGIVAFTGGRSGLRRFLGRLLLWRCPPGWYAFLIAGIPLLFIAGAWLKGSLFAQPLPFSSGQALAAALALAVIKGPVEEIGWRGLALPLLQRRLAPIWAGVTLGVVWGFWHLPAFLLSGTPQSTWSFMPFFVGTVAVSLILTPMFNASRGSILLPALFHFQLINPLWPDAQPYDTLAFVAAALVTVWINRKSLFSADRSATGVIPRGEDAAGSG